MTKSYVFYTAVVCIGVGLACASGAGAQAVPPLQLSLQEALRMTAEADPRLQKQSFARQGAEARQAQAALRPVTTLSAEVENVLGTGAQRTFSDAELTLSLGTTIEFGGKRTQRMAMANRESDRLEIELQAERLDVLAGVARQFIAVLEAQETLIVARDSKALAARVQSIVSGRVSSGVALPVERSNAEVAAIQAELVERQALSNVRAAWGQLVVSWGGAPESTGQAMGDLFVTPGMPAFSSLQTALERNPDILRFASEQRVREAALRLAEANSLPDIEVGAGVRRFQSTRDQALVLSASVPLGTAGRAAPLADEVRSQLNSLQAEEASRRNELLGALFGLRQRADAARTSLEVLQAEALPVAQRAQDQAESAFKAGRSSLLELTASQRQLLDLRRDKIEAAATYHLLVIDIERLMGLPLATAAFEQTSGSP